MINRREFLLSSGAFAFPFLTGCANFGYRANEKVNVAVIGIGARGAEDVESFAATGLVNFVAFGEGAQGVSERALLRRLPQDVRQDGRPD